MEIISIKNKAIHVLHKSHNYEDCFIFIVCNFFIYNNAVTMINDTDPNKYPKKNSSEILFQKMDKFLEIIREKEQYQKMLSVFNKEFQITMMSYNDLWHKIEEKSDHFPRPFFDAVKNAVETIEKFNVYTRKTYINYMKSWKGEIHPRFTKLFLDSYQKDYIGTFTSSDVERLVLYKTNHHHWVSGANASVSTCDRSFGRQNTLESQKTLAALNFLEGMRVGVKISDHTGKRQGTVLSLGRVDASNSVGGLTPTTQRGRGGVVGGYRRGDSVTPKGNISRTINSVNFSNNSRARMDGTIGSDTQPFLEEGRRVGGGKSTKTADHPGKIGQRLDQKSAQEYFHIKSEKKRVMSTMMSRIFYEQHLMYLDKEHNRKIELSQSIAAQIIDVMSFEEYMSQIWNSVSAPDAGVLKAVLLDVVGTLKSLVERRKAKENMTKETRIKNFYRARRTDTVKEYENMRQTDDYMGVILRQRPDLVVHKPKVSGFCRQWKQRIQKTQDQNNLSKYGFHSKADNEYFGVNTRNYEENLVQKVEESQLLPSFSLVAPKKYSPQDSSMLSA
jgi:hypothetical protein